jgi:hypothetical protein
VEHTSLGTEEKPCLPEEHFGFIQVSVAVEAEALKWPVLFLHFVPALFLRNFV